MTNLNIKETKIKRLVSRHNTNLNKNNRQDEINYALRLSYRLYYYRFALHPINKFNSG